MVKSLRRFLTWACTAAATAFMSAAGAGQAPGAGITILGPTTGPLPNCTVTKSQIKGVIRIRLPKRLTIGDSPIGAVRYSKVADDEDSKTDPTIAEELIDARTRPVVPGDESTYQQPYHIYLKGPDFGTTGYVLVRVIIDKDSTYSFWDSDPQGAPTSGIHGVGIGDGGGNSAICGNRRIISRDDGAKVARFFINLAEIARVKDRSFNIAIVPNDAKDTPIFIDPKVHNDG